MYVYLRNYSSKHELCNHRLEENSGVMSFTRWFRELRGKSNSKEEHSSRNVKVKDERRIKLNRTNSALPTNFKFFDGDFEDGKKRHDKKIKESDKRRYSFNGGSNTKLSRNPSMCLCCIVMSEKVKRTVRQWYKQKAIFEFLTRNFSTFTKVCGEHAFDISKVRYWVTSITWVNSLCPMFRFSLIHASVMFTLSDLRSATLPADVMRARYRTLLISNISLPNTFCKR
ncbi:hypothetical protein PGB90_000260 [Kerria lacca]